MHRGRQGGRDRGGGRSFGGIGDGLLGEGPPSQGMYDPMVNQQMNQLLLAQQMLQQQQAAFSGYPGGDYGMNDMGYMQGMGGYGGGGGGGGMRNDRKRVGGMSRDMDFKRRRRDSSGRGGDDRSRGRDVNKGGEGRDKNRSSRWDSDRDNSRRSKGEDYDPAEPTEDEDPRDKDSNLYCHVCNVSVYDDESFRRHLNGTKHNQRMNNVLTVHQMKSNQLKSRLKAEEHLRKIEGKRGGHDPDYFCKICNNSLTIPWERHRYSNIHKQRQLQVRRGCGWCNVHDFNNFSEVLEHRETEEHKKNALTYGKKKEDGDRSRSTSRERKSGNRGRGFRKDKKKEEEEDLTIPEFNAENPVGVAYVIPVTGFFCKLCHKFYNNEKSAKGAHCQTEAHYEKFKLAMETKIEAREKRRAEEAAAEAERKAKEEENKKNGDVEMKEDDEDGEKNEEDGDERHHDDEDYDDELPLEDEDEDGGLAKDDSLSQEEPAETTAESGLDDTNANSSFVFLSDDMAAAHLELQRQEMQQQKQPVGEHELSDIPAHGDDEDEDMEAGDQIYVSSQGEEETSVINLTGEEEDTEVTTSTPVAEATKAKAKVGTARRGRGRGKAKK